MKNTVLTFKQAKESGTKQLWLTHYSPAMNWPDNYKDAVKAIFKDAHISKDGRSIELNFEDDAT